MNMNNIRMPSKREILWPRLASTQSNIEEIISIARSIISKLFGVMPPAKATGRAKTMQILKMLLPTILPTKRSLSFFLAAMIVVISSGNEVPRAIIVREIMRSEIPIAVAMLEAELTTS